MWVEDLLGRWIDFLSLRAGNNIFSVLSHKEKLDRVNQAALQVGLHFFDDFRRLCLQLTPVHGWGWAAGEGEASYLGPRANSPCFVPVPQNVYLFLWAIQQCNHKFSSLTHSLTFFALCFFNMIKGNIFVYFAYQSDNIQKKRNTRPF